MHRRQSRFALVAAASAAVVSLFTAQTRAVTETFDNGGGDQFWNNNTNWNPDGAVAGNDAKFGATGSTASNSTVTNIVSADVTVNSLAYNQFATGANQYHITQINDGVTLTVNGTTGANGNAVYVGAGTSTGSGFGGTDMSYAFIQNQLSASTGGTFSFQNANGDIMVRQASSANSGHMATFDISKLSNFNANMRNLNVGVGDSTFTRSEGTMWLAFSNNINATAIQVGFNGGGGTTANPGAILYLGTNNTINTGSILVGGRATQGAKLGYNPTVTNGNLTIRGTTGPTSRADLSVGVNPVADTSPASSITNALFDLSAPTGFGSGSIDALINNLAIGRAAATLSSARSGVGALKYSNGTIDANNVTLGDDNATTTASTATGTITLAANAQMIVNNSMTLSKKTTGTGTLYTGSLIIDGTGSSTTPAKLRAATSILDAGGTSNITVSNGGTLQAKGLGTSASPIDNLTINNGTVIVDIGAAAPTAGNAWGYTSNLTAAGPISLGLQFSGTLTTGQFAAIKYSNTPGALTLSMTGKQPARVTAHAVDNTGNSSIDISVDSILQPKWNGNVSSNWDVNNTGNQTWILTGSGAGVGSATEYQEDLATYSTTDTVLFDDTATGPTNVNVTTTVSPNAVTVNNTTKAYTFSGTGKITGTTGIAKQGTNTLTISNTGGNDFTGALDIQGGTVNTGSNEVLPNAGIVNIQSGATLDLGSRTETISTLNVNGGLYSMTSGALTSGVITQTGGSLSAGSGTINATSTTVSGGTFTAGSGTITTTNLSVSGGFTVNPGTGSIVAPNITLLNGNLPAGNITTSAITAQQGQIDLVLTGATTLTVNGNATTTVTLTGNNTYIGLTSVSGGKLLITNSNSLGSPTGATANTRIEGAAASTNSLLAFSNNISVPEPLTFHGRNGADSANQNTNPHITNAGGNNTLTGAITLETGGLRYNIQSDAGSLKLAGNILNPIASAPLKTREIYLTGAGNGEVAGTVSNTPTTDTIAIVKEGAGTWTLSGANSYTGSTTVNAGTLKLGNGVALPSASAVVVNPNANLQVASSGNGDQHADSNTVKISSLTLNGNGNLDVTNNLLILPGTSLATVKPLIIAARNVPVGGVGDGSWDGKGIGSSTAAAHFTNAGIEERAVGYAVNSDLPLGQYATFGGQTVAGSDILIRYTRNGDADLDGKCGDADVTLVGAFYDNGVTTNFEWMNGDFNYDGKIDDADVTLLGAFYDEAATPLSGADLTARYGAEFAAAFAAGQAMAVPEPTTLTLLGLSALGLARRRRRN